MVNPKFKQDGFPYKLGLKEGWTLVYFYCRMLAALPSQDAYFPIRIIAVARNSYASKLQYTAQLPLPSIVDLQMLPADYQLL